VNGALVERREEIENPGKGSGCGCGYGAVRWVIVGPAGAGPGVWGWEPVRFLGERLGGRVGGIVGGFRFIWKLELLGLLGRWGF
jgi:hypothetical protein